MASPVNPIRLPLARLRPWLFFGLVGVTTLIGVALMLNIVGSRGVTVLEVLILGLFGATFFWISMSFWNAVIGFALMTLRRDPLSLERPLVSGPPDDPVTSRTALVMPVHNEDPTQTAGGLAAMLRSLAQTGFADRFDVFLLSDTSDAEIAEAEEASVRALRDQIDRADGVCYRRRTQNIGRKAGNIDDFCRRWGDDYDFMVVLDADSIMTGSTLVELVRAMQANPGAGLIQTVPVPARRRTLFGRLLQFAARLYSPILATGQSFWQTDAANYWGHNAIIRLAAFTAHCRLPVLPGRPPLGGAILSHDFVEAALLRRAGWHVYLFPQISGSFEEVPGNVFDYAKRDRRWSQGSLQHLRLLPMRGLHWLSRVHFLQGAMGYVSSALWLLLLLASTAYVILPQLTEYPYLGTGHTLWADLPAPSWTTISPREWLPLLGVTGGLLFLPKVLALGLALVRERKKFGGGGRLVISALLEMFLAVLVAPLMMMYHTRFLVSILGGHDIEWEPQARAGRLVAWHDAWWRTAGIAAVGAAWASLTISVSPTFFLWLTPIFVGLLLSSPLVRWTSSPSLGEATRRLGLFLVPSETAPPPELRPSLGAGWSVTDAGAASDVVSLASPPAEHGQAEA